MEIVVDFDVCNSRRYLVMLKFWFLYFWLSLGKEILSEGKHRLVVTSKESNGKERVRSLLNSDVFHTKRDFVLNYLVCLEIEISK